MKRNIINRHIGHYELDRAAKALYAILVCVNIVFLIVISIFQNTKVYQVRSSEGYETIQGYQSREVIDKDTPLGIRKEYRWKQKKILPGENCLAFYVVHQYAEVYFNGELMYSLKPQDENQIGKTIASNWVMIPLYPEDEGKDIRVDIIPAYKVVRNREVNFHTGSKFMIYFDQLRKDLPQIILSLITMGVGVIFVIISILNRYREKENANLTYLGIFSFAIGLWKLTDIRFAPLMFPKNTVALSYISISMLLIGVVPWILSIKEQFLRKFSDILGWISIFFCTIALIILTLQIANILDLRETLWITHTVIAIIVFGIVWMTIYERRKQRIDKKERLNKKQRTLYGCILLCVLGVVVDMVVYYIQGNSSGILCTLTAFLIYIITMGCMSINEINQKANIDIHTGLFNKSRCNQVLDENENVQQPLGIIMFDLNGLKRTNDNLGHEIGDILISKFANIVKENVPSENFVGRYGGDEFIAVIKGADNQRMEEILKDIEQAVAKYNEKGFKVHISYASGYALSNDYPEATLRELLKKADNHMYRNKRSIENRI